MGYAVARDGTYSGVAADDFSIAGGCRVTLIGSNHIGGEEVAQVGETANELVGDVLRFIYGRLVLFRKAEPSLYLLYKFIVEGFYIDSRVVDDGAVANAGVTEIAWK